MKKRMTLLIAGLATLVLVLSACQRGGVNSDDAALIRQQLEDVANRLNVVEDRIDELATDTGGSEMLISQVRSELSQARSTLAEVDDKLATSDDESMDDGLGNDGLNDGLNNDLNDGLNNLGNEARDTLDGMGDSLNQFGDNLNDGLNDMGTDVDQRIDDLQDRLNDDGFGNDLNDATPEPTPAQPGTGGGASGTTPGIPAAPGL